MRNQAVFRILTVVAMLSPASALALDRPKVDKGTIVTPDGHLLRGIQAWAGATDGDDSFEDISHYADELVKRKMNCIGLVQGESKNIELLDRIITMLEGKGIYSYVVYYGYSGAWAEYWKQAAPALKDRKSVFFVIDGQSYKRPSSEDVRATYELIRQMAPDTVVASGQFPDAGDWVDYKTAAQAYFDTGPEGAIETKNKGTPVFFDKVPNDQAQDYRDMITDNWTELEKAGISWVLTMSKGFRLPERQQEVAHLDPPLPNRWQVFDDFYKSKLAGTPSDWQALGPTTGSPGGSGGSAGGAGGTPAAGGAGGARGGNGGTPAAGGSAGAPVGGAGGKASGLGGAAGTPAGGATAGRSGTAGAAGASAGGAGRGGSTAAPDGGTVSGRDDSSGCGCRVGQSGDGRGAGWLLLAGVALHSLRRRRRKA